MSFIQMKTFLISIILLGLTVGLSPTLSPTPQGTTTEEAVTSTTAEDAVTFTTTEETATTTTTEEIVTEEPLSCSFLTTTVTQQPLI